MIDDHSLIPCKCSEDTLQIRAKRVYSSNVADTDPGSEFRCFLCFSYPWIPKPGWKNPDPGSVMNILVDISECLETIFWIKNT
jgi:hypothetical protein